MRKLAEYISVCLLALALAAACKKEERELMFANQETKIETFVNKCLTDSTATRVEYNGGAVRLVLTEGQDVDLNARGRVTFLYAGYNFTGGSISSANMFVTNNPDLSWDVSDSTVFQPVTVDMAAGSLMEGLQNGLIGVRAGEECYILFSGKYGLGKNKLGTIPANAPLAFHLWIQNIEN